MYSAYLGSFGDSSVPLRTSKFEFQHNAKSTCCVYCDYIVPEGGNCDVRLWNGKVNQRLNSSEKADFTFGERIRAHAPGTADWKNHYGHRSIASVTKTATAPSLRESKISAVRCLVHISDKSL